jgi:hypothetical protein
MASTKKYIEALDREIVNLEKAIQEHKTRIDNFQKGIKKAEKSLKKQEKCTHEKGWKKSKGYPYDLECLLCELPLSDYMQYPITWCRLCDIQFVDVCGADRNRNTGALLKSKRLDWREDSTLYCPSCYFKTEHYQAKVIKKVVEAMLNDNDPKCLNCPSQAKCMTMSIL